MNANNVDMPILYSFTDEFKIRLMFSLRLRKVFVD